MAQEMKIQEFQNHTFVSGLLPPEALVLDLGGNHGEFSASVRAHFLGAKIFVVEAHPALASEIQRKEIGQVMAAAVAGGRGEADFFLNQDQCATMLASMKQDGVEKVTVKTLPLAEVVEWTGAARIDLLKVDIEGAELDMFDSASDELLLRIDQMTVEFHDFLDGAQGPRVKAIVKRLCELGFCCVNFSWHTQGDVLFINPRCVRKVPLVVWKLRFWKYLTGLKRMWTRLGRAER